jgi:hypothetical protein
LNGEDYWNHPGRNETYFMPLNLNDIMKLFRLRPVAIACTWMLAAPFSTRAADPAYWSWAPTPPMGWNSWDCYGAGVGQTDALANADYMAQHLKPHGWNLITIDIQWYEPLAHTTEYRPGAVLETDVNGRLLPAPNRFPLTAKTRSFKPIADYLHAQGLKFGLHLMRGIPRQAVDRDNAPILGTTNHAADIADKKNVCRWNGDMYGVDMSRPGAQEYYDSVFAQLAAWDLDFVKVDDLAGHTAEIEAVRKAIDKTGRPMVFSISPGGSTVARGEFVATHANLWRISGDFWDSWGALYAQPYFVSPAGDDANPGTLEKPFATLQRAQQAARKKHGDGFSARRNLLFAGARSCSPRTGFRHEGRAGGFPKLSGRKAGHQRRRPAGKSGLAALHERNFSGASSGGFADGGNFRQRRAADSGALPEL